MTMTIRHLLPLGGMGTVADHDQPGIRLFADHMDTEEFVDLENAIAITKLMMAASTSDPASVMNTIDELDADTPEQLKQFVGLAAAQPDLAALFSSLVMHAVMDASDLWPDHPAILQMVKEARHA